MWPLFVSVGCLILVISSATRTNEHGCEHRKNRDTHNSFRRTAMATVLSLSLTHTLPVYSVWHYYHYELRSRWYDDMVVCWFVFNLAHCKQCVAFIHRPVFSNTYARLLFCIHSRDKITDTTQQSIYHFLNSKSTYVCFSFDITICS